MTATGQGNGSSRLKPFTFPDSGRTVQIRRIAPMLIRDLHKKFKPPKPPKQEVQFEKGVRLVPNPADPDYQAELAEYEGELGDRILGLVTRVGVVCEVPADEVAELRSQMAAEGVELPEDDKLVYVTRLCASSAADLTALQAAVLGESTVTEAQVAEATERFRREVPGH